MIELGLRSAVHSAVRNLNTQVEAARLADAMHQLQRSLGERFEVVRPIAIGGMATLFEVKHRQFGSRLVAKVLHDDLRARPEVVAGFQREARHLALLAEHPNLIPLLDGELHGGLLYLLFPFVEGEDLDRTLQRGALPEADVLHMAAQMSSVLCHMESHSIVHGDISPGNIRLDVFGRSRLLDFGVSRKADEPEQALRAGTPLYTSPEQIEGALPDRRSDLYALGLVIVEALTGTPLMQGGTLEAIYSNHLAGARELPKTLTEHPVLNRLLPRLLARQPYERFASAYELSGALAALGYERPEFHSSTFGKRRRRLESAPPVETFSSQ